MATIIVILMSTFFNVIINILIDRWRKKKATLLRDKQVPLIPGAYYFLNGVGKVLLCSVRKDDSLASYQVEPDSGSGGYIYQGRQVNLDIKTFQEQASLIKVYQTLTKEEEDNDMKIVKKEIDACLKAGTKFKYPSGQLA